MAYDHYFKDVSNLKKIDVYRVLELFGVTHPALAHAAKKILVSGNRGVKDTEQDVQEAIDSLLRWQEMRREDKSQSYADESGNTEQDLQAASLVHDLDEAWDSGKLGREEEFVGVVKDEALDPELVELCSKTDIHADADGWIPHVGDKCPLDDEWVEVYVRFKSGVSSLEAKPAYNWYWEDGNGTSSITHWRYAVPRKD